MVKLYCRGNTFRFLAEKEAIINFRFGMTAFGIKTNRDQSLLNKWYNPFPIYFEFFRLPDTYNMREIFKVGCRWIYMYYNTKGICPSTSKLYNKVGLKLGGAIVTSGVTFFIG